METQLTQKKKGLSLPELLTVVAMFGILMALFIPVFNDASKKKVDYMVEKDIHQVSFVIEKEFSQLSYSNQMIPNVTITSDSDTVFNKYIEVSEGTTITVEASDIPGEYVLYGINEDGNLASENEGIVYDSSAPIIYVSE